MIGDLVADELLLLWARHVYDELVGWDPLSRWASGQ